MAFTQIQRTAAAVAPVAQARVGGKTSDQKNRLRGLSYEQGLKALSPAGSLDEKDHQAAGIDAVQLKQAESKTSAVGDPKNDKGPPPEIEALGLKKVTVDCTLEAWAALSEIERAGVLNFLVAKEEQCKASKKLKSSKVTIKMGAKLEEVDEKVIAAEEKNAQDNTALMNKGKAPTQGQQGKTIGVKEGDVHVTETPKEKVTEVPIKEPKTMSEHFDAAGSTFDSADYKPEDMQQSGVTALLDQAAAQIKEYLALDPDARITLTVSASESHVPNPPQFKTVGSLAAARAANGVELARTYFAGLGIDAANLSFTTENLGANGPEWDPAISKHDAMYTVHQFVRLTVQAEVCVETDTDTKPDTETEETRTQDAELIKMVVTDDRKSSHKKKQRSPRQKKHRQKKHKKFRTIDCPVF